MGNQAEALKKISYDIYDFPVSLTTKASKKVKNRVKIAFNLHVSSASVPANFSIMKSFSKIIFPTESFRN